MNRVPLRMRNEMAKKTGLRRKMNIIMIYLHIDRKAPGNVLKC
jgi:hypothetical protein